VLAFAFGFGFIISHLSSETSMKDISADLKVLGYEQADTRI
jgi:hypothetical protein